MSGADSQGAPIFVVGASRSGTALMRSALNRSSSVFLAGETHYFDDLRPRLGQHATSRLPDDARELTENYFLALSHRPYGHGGEPERGRLDRSQLRALSEELGGSGDAYFQAFCVLARSLEADVAAAPSRWGEKTPRHVLRLSEMLTVYPGAQAICMYRDPRAVVASYGNWRHQGGLALDGDEGYAEALEAEEERARRSFDPSILSLLWRGTVTAGLKAQDAFGKSRVRLVRYEDLVHEPAQTLQGVMTFLGLTYDDAMLDVPMHNSSFSRFQRETGVSTAPVERWKSTLSDYDVALVQHWCRRSMESLGYSLVDARISPVTRARVLGSLPLSAGRAAWTNRERAGALPAYVWRRVKLLRSA